jgi:hypothetical protein
MARNNRRHGREALPISVTVRWAVDTAFDLWQLTHPEKKDGTQSGRKHWERPVPGWVKCNVDAAFCNTDRSASSGLFSGTQMEERVEEQRDGMSIA